MSNEKLYQLTTAQLKALGLNENHAGFDVLRTIIMVYVEDPGMMDEKFTTLSEDIAEEAGVSPKSACKLMQLAIRNGFKAGALSNWERFGWTAPPTAKPFCQRVAMHVAWLMEGA